MKSAFPALNNLQASLLAYKAKSESALRAEKVKFTQYGLMFKKNAADANLAELKKSATFKKFLKKRGMDEEAFNAKSVVNQRRSISLMIANLQKRAAAGKAINDAELAYFIKTRNQMVGVQVGIGAKLVGVAGATGAAVGAAITVPALLARLGLAKLGAAALALGPVFATLGAIISGAFTIFTVGFLAKFLYDILFVTKEEKEERSKILEILKTTELKLEEINRIGSKLFASATDDAIKNVDKLNNRLLATYNLIQGLSGRANLEGVIGDKEYVRKESDAASIASVFMQRFAALGSLGGTDDLRAVLSAANKELGPEYKRGFISDINYFMKKYQEGGVLTGDGRTVLMENLTRAILNMNTQEVFDFFDSLKQRTDELAKPGEGLYNVSEAAKEVKDSLAVMMDAYKPSSFDALSSSLQKLRTNFSDAMNKKGDGAQQGDYAAVLKSQLGLSFESDQKALDFVLERAAAVETIIARNAEILDLRNKVETKIAGLGSRKDAFAELEKKRLKELDLTNKVGEVQNNIRKEQEVLNLLGREATEIEERKLRSLERQRDVLLAQEKEYKRANTIAGQLQNTFQDGLDDMFLSIINGTASAKDAFKQLAVVVIQEMQRILAVRMASQIISMMTGMVTPGLPDTSGPGPHMSPVDTSATTNPFGSTLPSIRPGGRYGGVFGKGYATGGIADGPQSGYNVLMHGREAIVPLPDGDKIPVQLSGKGMGPTNTTINVVVNNEGESESTVEESTAFAEAVQVSVMQTIAEQQRPGGLLNPGG